jgi:hypothetical protein
MHWLSQLAPGPTVHDSTQIDWRMTLSGARKRSNCTRIVVTVGTPIASAAG